MAFLLKRIKMANNVVGNKIKGLEIRISNPFILFHITYLNIPIYKFRLEGCKTEYLFW